VAIIDPTVATGAPPTADVAGEVKGRSPWELFWLRFRKDKAAIAGLILIGILVLLAIFAPVISSHVVHHGPNQLFENMTTDIGIPKGPNSHFWFGADQNGRDVFVRTLYGARTSLVVAVFATGIATIIGLTLGVTAGFFRGWVDTAISRMIDIILSLPLLLFAIGIAASCSIAGEGQKGCLGGLIKPGLSLIIFIVALFSWTPMARIMRGQTLSIREKEFIEASRSLGASPRQIMVREVLPNLVAPIIIYSSLIIPYNILFESYLSFLGLRIP